MARVFKEFLVLRGFQYSPLEVVLNEKLEIWPVEEPDQICFRASVLQKHVEYEAILNLEQKPG